MAFQDQLAIYQSRVAAGLQSWLPPADTEPTHLHEAMRYATLGSGKRVRPILTYATGAALAVDLCRLDSSAVAVEMIHAYSLIHDDLPAMDDDDLRRGRPTCHMAFDEATAILAGDALQALAFQVLAEDPALGVGGDRRVEMLLTLAAASGSLGMAGGQAIDLNAVGRCLSLAELETMHLRKTGALIRASVKLGYLASDIDDASLAAHLDNYARCIGLAFQVRDDILDVEGSTDVIGKPQGSDKDLEKPTYPNILGMKAAKHTARKLCEEAVRNLEPLGEQARGLREMAYYVIARDR